MLVLRSRRLCAAEEATFMRAGRQYLNAFNSGSYCVLHIREWKHEGIHFSIPRPKVQMNVIQSIQRTYKVTNLESHTSTDPHAGQLTGCVGSCLKLARGFDCPVGISSNANVNVTKQANMNSLSRTVET